jgi:hypothetical protein
VEFSFFSEMPPEMQQQVKAHMDHQEMSSQDSAHTVFRELSEMEPKTLRFLRGFLMNLGDTDGMGQYFTGYITGILEGWYGYCPACGKNHDEELEKVVQGEDLPPHDSA